MEDLTRLGSEGENPASRNLDRLDTLSLVRVMNAEDCGVAVAVGQTQTIEQGGRAIERPGPWRKVWRVPRPVAGRDQAGDGLCAAANPPDPMLWLTHSPEAGNL